MEQFFQDYFDLLRQLHDGCIRSVEGLPLEAIDWGPGPELNSLAILVTHLTGAERYWIGDVACGDPSGRDRDAEFRVKGVPAADLVNRLHDSTDYARTMLANLRLDDLERLRPSWRDGREYTVGWALGHALEHTAQHLGHIDITRQMWEGR